MRCEDLGPVECSNIIELVLQTSGSGAVKSDLLNHGLKSQL